MPVADLALAADPRVPELPLAWPHTLNLGTPLSLEHHPYVETDTFSSWAAAAHSVVQANLLPWAAALVLLPAPRVLLRLLCFVMVLRTLLYCREAILAEFFVDLLSASPVELSSNVASLPTFWGGS